MPATPVFGPDTTGTLGLFADWHVSPASIASSAMLSAAGHPLTLSRQFLIIFIKVLLSVFPY
jgi:hypothetical protein